MARCLEDVSTTSWIRLRNVLKMSWICFCKTCWRCLGKTSWRRIYWSRSRRLEDVFWRRTSKANISVLIKTPSEDKEERLLQDVFIKTNVCWDVSTPVIEKLLKWKYLRNNSGNNWYLHDLRKKLLYGFVETCSIEQGDKKSGRTGAALQRSEVISREVEIIGKKPFVLKLMHKTFRMKISTDA